MYDHYFSITFLAYWVYLDSVTSQRGVTAASVATQRRWRGEKAGWMNGWVGRQGYGITFTRFAYHGVVVLRKDWITSARTGLTKGERSDTANTWLR